MILPSRYRERLASGLVVTRAMDRCLEIWPLAAFERRAEEITSRPMASKAARRQQRMFLSAAHDDVPDSQGRIVIPSGLREFAGLNRELVICGNDDKVEIWDLRRWEAELELAEADFADLDEPLEF